MKSFDEKGKERRRRDLEEGHWCCVCLTIRRSTRVLVNNCTDRRRERLRTCSCASTGNILHTLTVLH